MNKYILSFFLITCFAACDRIKHKQSDEYAKDSLSFFLENSYDESLPYKVRHQNAGKALSLISKRPNDITKRFYYFKIANRYYNMSAWPEYLSLTKQIINDSEDAKDTLRLATAYTYMTDYYSIVPNDDSLYTYNYKAEKLFRKLTDNGGVAKTLLNKAILQHNAGDYLGCERTGFEILKFLNGKDDVEMSYEANNLLGVVYGELQEYDLSKKYYDLALQLANSGQMSPEFQLTAATYNNLGFLYLNQKKYSKAREYFLLGLQQKNLLNDKPLCYATLCDNLGYANFKLGDLSQSSKLFNRSIAIKDSIKAFNTTVGTKNHLSEYYAFLADTTKAVRFAKEGYKIAQTGREKRELLGALRQLTVVDRLHSNKYSAQYYKIKDSLDVSERKAQNKFARIEYETDELATEKARLVEQRKTLIYIALGIILLVVLIFVIRSQAAKNRELRLIRDQQAANEEIYHLMITQQQQRDEGRQLEKKRIARELHDGVMGQLTAIRMNLFLLGRKQDPETIRQCLPHIDKIQDVEKEIRSIAYDLDTKLHDNTDFTEVIHTIFMGLEQHSGIRFLLLADESIDWQSVLIDTKVQLYRILQEALQNIIKYAKAGKVIVDIIVQESMLKIVIQDDGIGFDPKQVRKGLGLRNMQQRTHELGGTMTINTSPGNGTSLEFVLPLKNQFVE